MLLPLHVMQMLDGCEEFAEKEHRGGHVQLDFRAPSAIHVDQDGTTAITRGSVLISSPKFSAKRCETITNL